ncbi:MAG: UDP-N-acetylglucosamine--N-acetylmuramyl-(pentapeptide) pyrophosphoryl-undecaprenol N-acetylglucosamine transferase [Thermodesulfobacteriota bacterium]
MNKKKIIICLGATGGHVFPGIALADALKQSSPDYEILFINTLKSNEMLPKLNFNYKIIGINIYGFVGKNILEKIKSIFSLFICIGKTLVILKKFKPEIVIGSGGFVWLPVGISSFILNKKIYTIEGNSIPGLANKIISKLSKKIFINFESSLNYFEKSKCFNLGYPIREIEKKREPRKDIDILIIGGSQGSKTLNTRFLDQIEDLLNRLTKEKIKEFTIIHQTGMEDFHRVKKIASQI